MGESEADLSFLSDTPNAKVSQPPANLFKVAEEVDFGLRLAFMTVQNRFTNQEQPHNPFDFSRKLHQATEIFKRFINDVAQSGYYAAVAVAGQPIEAERLGVIHNSAALFGDEILLRPGQSYPLNYYGHHRLLTSELRQKHGIAEADNVSQIFMGFIPPDNPYNGFAISLRQFLESQARLSTVGREGFEEGMPPE